MSRLQVFNWGTFSDVHDIPIAERGFLFVGRSGSGKTTLLDALSTLLVPPKWIDYGAAVRGAENRDRHRNLLSYVRGAWAEQQDHGSGEIAPQYLRTGTTWSALALTYVNESGETVVLVQLLWIRGKSCAREDLHRLFLIFERAFDIRELEEFGLDVRRLKQKFPEAFARDDFAPYAARFCRRLGIENELALRLLHKTQSAKNLGDLNLFFRDFMLDKPATFTAADRLVDEFADLNAAHQAVVTAREQIDTLAPAREEFQSLQSLGVRERELNALRSGLDAYKQTLRAGLLQDRIMELEAEAARKTAEEQRRHSSLDNEQAALDDLRQQHREAGGLRIEELKSELGRTEKLRDERLRKRQDVQVASRKLGCELPASPSDFAALATAAARELASWPEQQERSRERYAALSAELTKCKQEFDEAREEAESLGRQPSNVDVRALKIRSAIAAELGLAEAALPFAAELIEVRQGEEEWRGAIERVLRGFSLSILVEERYYAAVSDLVNRRPLDGRLLYNRVPRESAALGRQMPLNALVRKLEIKEGPFEAYIDNTLQSRFDYVCVDSMQAFRNTEKAVTRQGQLRHAKDRHEKDDRWSLDDRRHWYLGFDNRAKLALFQKRAQDAAGAVDTWTRKLRNLAQEEQQLGQRVLACQTLANTQWQEIDVPPLLARITSIQQSLQELREGNATLNQLGARIEAQEKAVASARGSLVEIQAELKGLDNEIRKERGKLEPVLRQLRTVDVTELQKNGLTNYFNALNQARTLDNLDTLALTVDRKLGKEETELLAARNRLTNSIEKRFAEFQRRWRMDAGDLDATLASASEFFAKLKRLETDRLPDYEHRFFDLLRNQSHQNLAAVSKHMSEERKTIYDRLDIVNESLGRAQFDQGTFLRIEASDRNLEEVREFKQQIQQALSHAWTDDREQAEERFLVLRDIVRRLSSQESEDRRWRTLVLDVRQHVEFIGRESDQEGKQVEVYRGGATKSGGQRQKLAATCLAAALRYQLGGDDQGLPLYAPVVLDEAFDQADNEFTALAMNIFTQFGFQMIVATPLKLVMTLEPFIGGACFVSIAERRRSGVLMIEYDNERQRLKLPEQSHDEAHASVS
jgi:uncharacterized protein YPO0396